MSAIGGAVGVDGRPWREADLDGVIRALSPLGPDGSGSWSGMAGRCGVVLGAALWHRTPEDTADRQPAQNEDGSAVVIADVRLDNRLELAVALDLADDKSLPDSQILLRAYERWGEAMLDRLVGEFAVAVVDRRRGGVLLARDPMGARPLLVHRRPGLVAFASTPLALTELEGVGHDLDLDHAAEILVQAFGSERTFVRGVRWLPPGTALWADDSAVRHRTWWDPAQEVADSGSLEEHARALREAFDAAVGARLRSVGRVGATLSGGLDSSSVAAVAASLLAPRSLPTFTSAPSPGWHGAEQERFDADESPLVLALAGMHSNIDPTFVHVAQDADLLGLQEPLWEVGAGPAANPCNLLWLLDIRARAAGAGVTTLLTGDLGNVFFSADGPLWLAAHLRRGRYVTAIREAAAWNHAVGTGWYEMFRKQVVPYVTPGGLVRLVGRGTRSDEPRREWMAITALRAEVAAGLELPMLPQIDPARRKDPRAVAMSIVSSHAGQADVSAALGAVTGVESRDPTSDRRVVEAAMRQPEWVRRYGGVTRAVARGAMRERLPAAILHRTQRGEQLPEWLDIMTARREELAAELEEVAGHPASRELIDVDRLRGLMQRWPDPSARGDMKVITDYRLALLRALVVSRYLRWFERRGAATDKKPPRAETMPARGDQA